MNERVCYFRFAICDLGAAPRPAARGGCSADAASTRGRPPNGGGQDRRSQALIKARLMAARSASETLPRRLSKRTRGSEPMACTLATDWGSRKLRWPTGISSSLPRDWRVIGTWIINVLGASRSSANSTMTGRVLPAIPMSASQTSPWRGCIAVKAIEHFLLNLPPREHVRPLLLLTLMIEKPQIMPDFPQNVLGLTADFFDQLLLCRHYPTL